MKLSDFHIGMEFWIGGRRWRCTDIGTRTIAGICLEEPTTRTVVVRDGPHTIYRREPVSPEERPSWHRGPPYAVVEYVFDEETALAGARATEAEWKADFA